MIGTNSLQTDELWASLSLSTQNLAILLDYVLTETFKSGRFDGVRSAFSILGRFPDQVVALKATGEVSLLDPDRVTMSEARFQPSGSKVRRWSIISLSKARILREK